MGEHGYRDLAGYRTMDPRFRRHADTMWTHVVLGLLVAAISAWALWDERQNPHARA
jgi:hypothetical protein